MSREKRGEKFVVKLTKSTLKKLNLIKFKLLGCNGKSIADNKVDFINKKFFLKNKIVDFVNSRCPKAHCEKHAFFIVVELSPSSPPYILTYFFKVVKFLLRENYVKIM